MHSIGRMAFAVGRAVRMPAGCPRNRAGATVPSPVLARAVATRCTNPLEFADRYDGWAIPIALLEIHPRGEGQQNNCKDPKGRIAHSSFLGHGHILTRSVVSAKKSEVRGIESGTKVGCPRKRTTPCRGNDQCLPDSSVKGLVKQESDPVHAAGIGVGAGVAGSDRHVLEVTILD